MLSLPLTATALASRLYWYDPLAEGVGRDSATTIAVFDGDYSRSRVAEASRLFGLIQPWRVIVSGPSWFRESLIGAGIPARRMVWDGRSRNTREQALELRRLTVRVRPERIVLVTSPLQMPRALAACHVAGVVAVPAVARAPHLALGRGIWGIVPDVRALALSREALYEYLALAYYRFNGWQEHIRPVPGETMIPSRLNEQAVFAATQRHPGRGRGVGTVGLPDLGDVD